MHSRRFFSDMEPNSGSDHDEGDERSQRGPTWMKRKKTNHKGKPPVTYNSRGVPIGETSTKLSTFEGVVARSMIPITYESWNDVSADTKEEIWQYVLANYDVDPKSWIQTLQSIGTKWRNFKHTLYKDHIEVQKDDPELKNNLLNPPPDRLSVGKSEWKVFVSQRTTKTWQEKSKKAKEVRALNIYNHHLSRKGYARLQAELMAETGKTEEEIDRVMLWKKARERKSGGFDKHVQDKMQNDEGSREVTCGTNDVLTQALGTKEQRGHVRGMGRFVRPHQYFYLPKTVKHYMENEKKKYEERFNKLEDEMDKMKRGMNNVSEAGSCQMWGNEDFKDHSFEETVDNACYLAVDVPSNIVAKGIIMKDTCKEENVEVKVEIALQTEAEVPNPLVEEFVETVADAIGHVLSWPSYLVIRCSDLEKAVAKPKKKPTEKTRKEIEIKKRPRKDDEENKKEDEKELDKEYKIEDEKRESKKQIKGKIQVVENVPPRRMTRAQRNQRIRMDTRGTLLMAALVVDGQLKNVESLRLPLDEDVFGHESFTYVYWDDFEAVFTMNELSGGVISSYIMLLDSQIKSGQKSDHGTCFANPTIISPADRKPKFQHNIEQASRVVVDRLLNRNGKDIILLPYNPGNHWVLAVLDMKGATCYYLDSLCPGSVFEPLRQIIDMATTVYSAQTSTGKRFKLRWVNTKCPCQSGVTECGYYVMKFMKEIVTDGLGILDYVGGGVEAYSDADIDYVREEWSGYASTFIFKL